MYNILDPSLTVQLVDDRRRSLEHDAAARRRPRLGVLAARSTRSGRARPRGPADATPGAGAN